MRTIRLGLFLAGGAYALAATPASAQDAICCMRLVRNEIIAR
jgi:hypothetical protein